jgi:galactokinase
VTENLRVVAARHALARRDMRTMGRLLAESHASMRDDYEISLPEIDCLVELASAEPGCIGARLTGAGFGGAAVALVEADRAGQIAASVVRSYASHTGKRGGTLLVTADDGARIDYRA